MFLTTENCKQHLLKKHALRVWDGIGMAYSAVPTESAFRGKLRQYYLKVGEKVKDLLQVTMQIKEELDAVKGQRGPEPNATPCGSSEDHQNSHCARRGRWHLRKDHVTSKHLDIDPFPKTLLYVRIGRTPPTLRKDHPLGSGTRYNTTPVY